MRKTFILCIIVMLVAGTVAVSCKKKAELKPVKGVLEEAVREGTAPEQVSATMERHILDKNFEMTLNDTVNQVHVWSLMSCDSVTSSEGFGIVVAKEGRATIFTDIRHGSNPSARYNAATGELWLTGASIEGTGVHVERFYVIRFPEDGPAYLAATIDPYEMQEAFCNELKYSTKKEVITLYNGEQELTKVTNTVKDMGGFDDETVWLGEQISYDISGDQLHVNVIPGVNFITGKVLHYDDMPTVTALVTLTDGGGFSISNISLGNTSNK